MIDGIPNRSLYFPKRILLNYIELEMALSRNGGYPNLAGILSHGKSHLRMDDLGAPPLLGNLQIDFIKGHVEQRSDHLSNCVQNATHLPAG